MIRVSAASLVLAIALGAGQARGQAMGKAVVDAAAPAPALAEQSESLSRPSPAFEKAADLAPASLPTALPSGSRPGLDLPLIDAKAGPLLAAATPSAATAATSTTPSTVAIESPKPSGGRHESPSAAELPKAADPLKTEPAPATIPPAHLSAIEQKPIRPRSTEALAPATTTQPGSGGAGGGKSASGGMFSGLATAGQVGAALAIVIGLIFIAKALAKKFVPGAGATSGKGVIEVLARQPISKGQAIVLVRIGSQIVALNQGKDSSESVLVISEPMEVARIIGQIEGQSPKSIQAGFNKLLANARVDLEQGGEDPLEEPELRGMGAQQLDEQLEEMAAAKRQLMELRQHVRSVRDSLPRS